MHPGNMVVVRAQTDVPAGTEITISYTDTLAGNVVRRQTIKDLWYFLCSCERCTDTTELGTFISAVKCRMCAGNNCESYILPRDSQDMGSDWCCHLCTNIISNQTIVTLIKGLTSKVKEKFDDLCSVRNLIANLEEFLHPNHFLILELKQKWVNLAAKSNKTGKDDLETMISYISEITKINKTIDPGLTLTLGENLKLLNKAMLNLGKIRMAAGEINQKEFMNIALGAAANIKFAKRCFENSYKE